MMVEYLGFALLPRHLAVGYADSLAFVRESVAVFDLRPANVVKTEDNLILVIDAIPVRLTPGSATILQG